MSECYGFEKEDITLERFQGGEYLCEDCIEKLDNQIGYCNLDCQLGFGCDGSC
jgi:hypothetical protein